MNAIVIYPMVLAIFLLLVIYLQTKYGLISNAGTVAPKVYSFARVQLVWWTFLTLSTLLTATICTGDLPSLSQSTLILLGIGSLTTISARLIDISDIQNFAAASAAATATGTVQPAPLSQTISTGHFLSDILSDTSGISIHRLQAFIFNLIFGLWFIYQSFVNLAKIANGVNQSLIDSIIPEFSQNNLILLGLSAGVYTALKSTENK